MLVGWEKDSFLNLHSLPAHFRVQDEKELIGTAIFFIKKAANHCLVIAEMGLKIVGVFANLLFRNVAFCCLFAFSNVEKL